jgi:hypothetical protein
MVAVIKLLNAKLDDAKTERARQNLVDAVSEIQGLACVPTAIIKDRALVDGATTLIPHGLGRAPNIVLPSPPRGAVTSGRIEEIRTGVDRSRYVGLKATGFGATITVDVEVK